MDDIRKNIWANHWRNAKNSTTLEQLNNLLKNHKRIKDLNNAEDIEEVGNRLRIIDYLETRIINFNNK